MCPERKKEIIEWLECLSKGIDPISGTLVVTDSILNNRQIASVLADAAALVRGMLNERIGIFAVLSDFPVVIRFPEGHAMTISDLCTLINDTLSKRLGKKIRPQEITFWLEKEGYLHTRSNREGYLFRAATAKGERLGIHPEGRVGCKDARYVINYCDNAACDFIIANLGSIMLDMR